MTRLTADQRQWIISQPDQPAWLISANFEERFGLVVSNKTILHLRREARGTSNAKHNRGASHRADWPTTNLLKKIEWFADVRKGA